MIPASPLRRLESGTAVQLAGGRNGYVVLGRNGRPMLLSASAFQLLASVQAGLSFKALAESLSQGRDRKITAAEVESKYRGVADRCADLERGSSWRQGRPGELLRVTLIPEALVARLSPAFSVCFQPRLVGFLSIFIAGSAGLFASSEIATPINAQELAAAYGLYFLSLVIHELGHTSACVHFGARPGAIGFMLHWIWPVLYADVLSAWQLERRQRVVVDLAGVYLQLVAGSVFAVAYLSTGWRPLAGAAIAVALSCLIALNPGLRFDGYWALADALGIHALSQQPGRLLRHALQSLEGKSQIRLGWSSAMVGGLILYVVATVTVWSFVSIRIVPMLLRHAGELLVITADFAVGGGSDSLAALRASLALAVTLFIAARLMRHIVLRTRSWIGRPARP